MLRQATRTHLGEPNDVRARRYAEKAQRLERQRERIARRLEEVAAVVRDFDLPYS